MSIEGTEHRQLAAIMFTDMVGYTALTQRNEKLAPVSRLDSICGARTLFSSV